MRDPQEIMDEVNDKIQEEATDFLDDMFDGDEEDQDRNLEMEDGENDSTTNEFV